MAEAVTRPVAAHAAQQPRHSGEAVGPLAHPQPRFHTFLLGCCLPGCCSGLLPTQSARQEEAASGRAWCALVASPTIHLVSSIPLWSGFLGIVPALRALGIPAGKNPTGCPPQPSRCAELLSTNATRLKIVGGAEGWGAPERRGHTCRPPSRSPAASRPPLHVRCCSEAQRWGC